MEKSTPTLKQRNPEGGAKEPSLTHVSIREVEDEKTEEKLIDLYSGFDSDDVVDSDKELEELKRIAQMDALRAYSFLRRHATALKVKLGRLPGNLFKILTHKRLKTAATVIVAVLIVSLAIQKLWPVSDAGDVKGLGNQSIAFDPLEPPTEDRAGITTTKYDSELEVLSYDDIVGGKQVTVTQQPLPQQLINRGGVEALAAELNAGGILETVTTSKGVAYAVNNSSGGRTLVMAQATVLMFINSTQSVGADEFKAYIEKLK